MTSPSTDVDKLASEIERLLLNRSFELASRNLEDLKEEADQGNIPMIGLNGIDDLSLQLQDDAESAIHDARGRLDTLLNVSPTKAEVDWLDRARKLLSQWEDAVLALRSSEAELNLYKRRIDEQSQIILEYQEFNLIKSYVEEQWRQAQQIIAEQPTIGANFIMPYYTRANDRAKQAAAEKPDNELLKALHEQTSSRREQIARQEEAMTSGVMLKDFVTTLQYLNELSDDEMPMIYNEAGRPLGRKSKQEAIEETRQRARLSVQQTVAGYMENALKLLQEYRPRAALEELERYKNFEALERLIPGGSLSADTSAQYNILRRDVQQELDSLLDAERRAQSALEQVQGRNRQITGLDVTSAWGMLQEASSIYEGSRHSDVIARVRRNLTTETMNLLDEQLRSAENALNLLKLDEGSKLITETLEAYANLKIEEAPIRARLESLDKNFQRVTDLQQKQLRIRKDLAEIQRFVNTEPERANQEFDRLRQTYVAGDERRLLESEALYEQLQSAINAQLNTDADIAYLVTFLNTSNLARVAAARDNARKKAEDSHQLRREKFEEVADQLAAYHDFLQAQNHNRNGQLREAYTLLQNLVARENRLPDTIRQDVRSLFSEVQDNFEQANENEDRITQAKEALSKNNAELAYRLLSEIKLFTSAHEESNIKNLKRRASQDLQTQIEEWLRKMVKVSEEFSLAEMNENLALLDSLNANSAADWRRRVSNAEIAASAREAADVGLIGEALGRWESIRNQVIGADRSYVDEQISELSLRIVEKTIDEMHTQVLSRQEPSNRSLGDELLTQIIEKKKELQKLVDTSRKANSKALFQSLLLQVIFDHAQYSGLDNAEPILKESLVIGNSLSVNLSHIQDKEQQLIAEARALAAKDSPKLIELMRDFYRDIAPAKEHGSEEKAEDLNRFNKSFAAWKDFYNQHGNQFPIWYRKTQRELEELFAALGVGFRQTALNEVSGRRLLYGMKLLILDPAAAEGIELKRELEEAASGSNRLELAGKNLHQSIMNAQEPAMDNLTIEPLDNDIQRVKNLLDYSRYASQIALHFGEKVFEKQSQINDLRYGSDICINELSAFHKQLLNFQKEAQQYMEDVIQIKFTVQHYPCFLDEQQYRKLGYQHVDADPVSERLRLFRQKVAQEMQEHPIFQAIIKSSGVLIDKLIGLMKTLFTISEKTETEGFEEANRLYRTLQVDVLRTHNGFSPFYSEFSLTDTWAKREIKGLDKIGEWLQLKQKELAFLKSWQDHYCNADSGKEDDNESTDESKKKAGIVDWDVIKRDAEQQRDSGAFSQAKKLISTALEDNLSRKSLRLVIAELENPPLAMPSASADNMMFANEPKAKDAYDRASKEAGSRRGQEVLQTVRMICLENYKASAQDAQATLKLIDGQEVQWQQHSNDFTAFLAQVSAERRAFFPNQEKINGFHVSAEQALSKMRAIAPHHKNIAIFEGALKASQENR